MSTELPAEPPAPAPALGFPAEPPEPAAAWAPPALAFPPELTLPPEPEVSAPLAPAFALPSGFDAVEPEQETVPHRSHNPIAALAMTGSVANQAPGASGFCSYFARGITRMSGTGGSAMPGPM